MSGFRKAIEQIKAKLGGYLGRDDAQPPKPVADASTKPFVPELPPRISVIIPIHGTEAYVEKCVRSVMAQTLREIEILCIDDCSPDNSAVIVERLTEEDGRVRLIRHARNLGLGGARNTGIAAARAPYLASVDSDDYILPEMLERLWAEAGNQTADIVACGIETVSAEGDTIETLGRPAGRYRNDDNALNILSFLMPSFCNKLWRTSLFIDNGIRFPEHLYYEDLATTPRVVHHAKDIRIISDPLYRYVIRGGSIMNRASERHILDYFRCYDILGDFLRSEGVWERYRDDFLTRIGSTLHYHTKGVMASDKTEAEKLQYLRTMLMLKLGYLGYRDRLHDLDAQTLQKLIAKAASRQDVERMVPAASAIAQK